jgi:hypothetical protein
MREFFFAIYICAFTNQLWSFDAQPCPKVYSVEEVIQSSRLLNGKTICVAGLIRSRIGWGIGTFAWGVESRKASSAAKKGRRRIGIVDGAEAKGVPRNQYKPASFELLEVDASPKNVGPDGEYVHEVEVRGVFVLDKQIVKGLMKNWPRDYPFEPPSFEANRFEFLLLEVLSAHLLSAHLLDKVP